MLQYAIEHGMIDYDSVLAEVNMNERRRYLEMHNFKIWQTGDGEYKTYVPDTMADRGKKLIRRKSKKGLEDFLVDYYKELEVDPYLVDVFNAWSNEKLEYEEIQKQTYDRYKTDYDRFFKGSSLEKKRFRYITERELEKFIRDTIHDKQLSAKAWSGLRLIINGMFKYAKKHGYTEISISEFIGDLDLSKKIFTKKYKSDTENVFEDAEVQRIMSLLNTDNLLDCGVMLAFLTGMRAGELTALTWDDITDTHISITKTEIRYKDADGHYKFEIRNSPKTDAGFRKIVLTNEAKDLIAKMRESKGSNEYVFFKNGKRITSKLFSCKLYRVCNQLGITQRSLHKARKTYATKLLMNNVPENVIKSLMGHTDILTTKSYYYFNNQNYDEVQGYLENALNYC